MLLFLCLLFLQGVPMADELGVATSIQTLEISSTRVTQILCR